MILVTSPPYRSKPLRQHASQINTDQSTVWNSSDSEGQKWSQQKNQPIETSITAWYLYLLSLTRVHEKRHLEDGRHHTPEWNTSTNNRLLFSYYVLCIASPARKRSEINNHWVFMKKQSRVVVRLVFAFGGLHQRSSGLFAARHASQSPAGAETLHFWSLHREPFYISAWLPLIHSLFHCGIHLFKLKPGFSGIFSFLWWEQTAAVLLYSAG